MENIQNYIALKKEIIKNFTTFVKNNHYEACIEYFDNVEDYSQEDALVFAIEIIKYHMDKSSMDHDFYDHLSCMVYHGGNPAMLNILLREKNKSSNKYIKSFLQELILDLTNGLQYTARKGFNYDEEFLSELSCSLKDL